MMCRGAQNLLAIVVLACMLIQMFPIGAFAETIDIAVEKQATNNDICYSVRFPDNSQIAAFQMEVIYDPLLVEYQSNRAGTLFSSGIGQVNDKESGKIHCVFITATPLEEGGLFWECTFKTRGNGATNTEPVAFQFIEIADSKGRAIDRNIQYIGFLESQEATKAPTVTTVKPLQNNATVTKDKPSVSTTTTVAMTQGDVLKTTAVDTTVQTTITNSSDSEASSTTVTHSTTTSQFSETEITETVTSKTSHEDDVESDSRWTWLYVVIGVVVVTGCVILLYIFKKKGSR